MAFVPELDHLWAALQLMALHCRDFWGIWGALWQASYHLPDQSNMLSLYHSKMRTKPEHGLELWGSLEHLGCPLASQLPTDRAAQH